MTPHASQLLSHAQPFIGGQINALRQRVLSANTPGNLDGLLAWHILGQSPNVAWNVDPMSGSWLPDNADRLQDPAALAVLGYGLIGASSATTSVKAQVSTGLHRLMQRDLFPGDRLSVLHDIRILFGLHLAAGSVSAELPEARQWLRATLADPRMRAADRFHGLAQQHVQAELSDTQTTVDAHPLTAASDLAMAYWMIEQGTATLVNPSANGRELQQMTMSAALSVSPPDMPIPAAALLLWAAERMIASSADQILLGRTHLGQVLRRFEAAMRRWRWDSGTVMHPVRWEIRSEREVQAILWTMLRSVFNDVLDEDALPKLGHSSYRADFALPGLGVLVEAKYAYKGADFKNIEQEVMIDSIAYLQNTDRYKEIVVFIYDESASVEHHDLTRRTLLDLAGVSDVVIVCRPGFLSAPARTSARRQRK